MAHNLKINIRKRAVGSFFEWDKLDQAAGGREQAIGTKLHQTTRQAISKRKPALMNAIRKFNKYCEMLAKLHNSDWTIPLPQPLPTQLTPLRECPHLMEDVWITPCPGNIPAWLEDIDVREGIRAMLKLDRCHEELCRLGTEGNNLCRWFGQEIGALEVAIATPSNATLLVPLCHRRDRVLHLKKSFAGVLTGMACYEYHVENAQVLVQRITRTYVPSYTWITPQVQDVVVDHLFNDENTISASEDTGSPEPPYLESNTTILGDYLLREEAVIDDPTAGSEGIVLTNTPLIWLFTPPTPSTIPCQFHHPLGIIAFSVDDIAIMENPTAWLNDTCINGIARYLHATLSHATSPVSRYSSQCALFSTFDLLMIRYNASDEEIWRRTRKLEYWSKDVWILPIHRRTPKHWVVCTIHLSSRKLYLFDSFAARAPWKHEIQVSHYTCRAFPLFTYFTGDYPTHLAFGIPI
ncbi:hypothetical protein BDZ94DRAFT_1176434 [Collybia nuda]|uniref:Ubiquitin-like protease family profile domain-containing protein n=1 Tax=Collybia nuda TaxID=64659 RepID=A0A9P6C9D4_9AGAR|nr:hypothetical protein BDZ94DRAFT_1176434 [Collybia nuda]